MDNARASDLLQHLYLTGVRPNGKNIGVGAYGRVFEVEYCGSVFAAKEIHSVLVQGVRRVEFEITKKAFLTECVQSSILGHPNVVQVLGVYNPGGHSLLPVLVMERMQESLTSVVEKYPNIPMYVKLSMLLDVAQGLWYLHTHHLPIVHRDLSPNNVLLTSQFVAKISDLGVAKVIQADSKKTKTRAPGTVDFMPPEALLDTPEYGPPLDVFSYGGVILHLVNQEWPKPLHFVIIDPKTKKQVALSEAQRRQEHIDKLSGAPAGLQLLVKQCLHDDSAARPLISDVFERMKWIKEVQSIKCPHVNMNPITWQQVERAPKMFKETKITAPVQQEVADSQMDIFSKTVKWKELSPLPVGCVEHTAVILGRDIFVGGGFEGRNHVDYQDSYRLDVYNLTTNQWSSSLITTPYCSFAMTVLDDKLLVAGGATTNDEVTNKVLVLNAGQWEDYSEMPTARCDATAIGYHSMLIVVGGANKVEDKWIRISTTELLDTTNGRWYTCGSLPFPHQQQLAAINNTELYLLSGFDKDNKPSSQVFYTSLTNLLIHQLSWQLAPNTPWRYSAPVVLYNTLLTVGGLQQAKCTSEVNSFNPCTNEWKHFANILAARAGAAVVSVANDIIVMGGTAENGELSKTVWIGMFV